LTKSPTWPFSSCNHPHYTIKVHYFSARVNPAGANGLFYGNPGLLVAQLIEIVVVELHSFIGSYLILKLVGLITPLRVTVEEELAELDMSQHGEHAYAVD